MRIQKTSLAPLFALLAGTLPLTPGTSAQTVPTPGDRPEVSKPWPQQAVRAPHGMVATDEELGSQAGVEILKRGGNAVDAAVAVAFALAVVEPAAGQPGGGGLMPVRPSGGQRPFLGARRTAPGQGTPGMH